MNHNNLMLFIMPSTLHPESVWLKQKPDVTLQISHRFFYCEWIPWPEGFVNYGKWWRELGAAEEKVLKGLSQSSAIWGIPLISLGLSKAEETTSSGPWW